LLNSRPLKQRHGSSKARRRQSALIPDQPAPPLPAVRRWLFRLAALILAPLLALGILEAALRLAGYGYDTQFFQHTRIEDKDYLVNNDDFVLRFFPPEKARLPRPIMMEAVKPPEVYRIFIMGESAAEGDPDPAFGAARFLEVLLRERFPKQAFEVVNVAITANNSHGILPIARDCAGREGDLWIIYMGNNEMVGPYGAATVFGARAPPLRLVRASLAIQQMRVGQWLTSLARHATDRSSSPSSWGGLEMFVENRISPNDTRKETVYRNFQRNLQDILQVGLSSHAKIILNLMAVNLRDCPPLASMPSTTIAAAEQSRRDAYYAEGSAAKGKGDFSAAAQCFERAAELDPQWADAQYRSGECLLRLARSADARGYFRRACDDDALPARADSRINSIIRQTSRRFPDENLVLFDAPAALAANDPTGICGGETFYEHVHFNYSGSFRLGRAWAEQVEGLLPEAIKKSAAGPWMPQSLCERRLAMTDWNRRNDLSEVVARRHAPPLSGQSNNAEQLAALQTELAVLNKRMDSADAAQAEQLCREAIERAPRDFDLRCNFADFLEATGNANQAEEQWREVQRIMPRYYLGYFQQGRMLERLSELELARSAFRRTVELRPAMAQAWFELSNIDASQGNLPSAVEELERARRLQPRQPVFYACLGKLLSRMGRHDDALKSFRQALEVDSNYWDGHLALGDELAAVGSLPEAQIQFETCIKQRPDSPPAHVKLGAALAQQGQSAAARHEFEEALRLDPANKPAQELLSQMQPSR
jgi:tetratricopeptide (TPR) repeat protein